VPNLTPNDVASRQSDGDVVHSCTSDRRQSGTRSSQDSKGRLAATTSRGIIFGWRAFANSSRPPNGNTWPRSRVQSEAADSCSWPPRASPRAMPKLPGAFRHSDCELPLKPGAGIRNAARGSRPRHPADTRALDEARRGVVGTLVGGARRGPSPRSGEPASPSGPRRPSAAPGTTSSPDRAALTNQLAASHSPQLN
jgi:hypothetical protein